MEALLTCMHTTDSRRMLALMLTLILLGGAASSGQSLHTPQSSGLEFLPGGTVFPPLTAHPQEPRSGVRKEFGTSRLKLDIGSTLDLLEWNLSSTGSERIRVGVQFFSYALTTSSEGLRLQVDAIDGFFGGHIAFRSLLGSSAFSLRLRIMHLSAHFVDGHFDDETGTWKDGRSPLPFTRDFGELVGLYDWYAPPFSVSPYVGINYATLVRPTDIKRWAPLFGIILRTSEGTITLLGKPSSIYIADHLTLWGIPAYTGQNTLEGGIKLGAWNGAGIRFAVSLMTGPEVFSQYYNVSRTSWGLGFAYDVF